MAYAHLVGLWSIGAWHCVLRNASTVDGHGPTLGGNSIEALSMSGLAVDASVKRNIIGGAQDVASRFRNGPCMQSHRRC